MLSRQQRKDRRRGYSFPGHFRRVVNTKGLRHVIRSVGGTLLIVGGTLAYCSGSSITGPQPPRELTTRKSVFTEPTRSTTTDGTIGDLAGDGRTQRFPIEGTQNNCNNMMEAVPFRGHGSITLFASEGGVTHQRVQTQYVFDGTGSLGNVYHGSGGHSEIINTSVPPMTVTIHDRVRMTSRTAPDMYTSFKFHMTINGQGQMTAFVQQVSTNCDDVSA
jgi:hypothetical protein